MTIASFDLPSLITTYNESTLIVLITKKKVMGMW